jgi:2-methylcitrate dehydratase
VDLAQIEAVRVQAYRVATSTAATEPEKWEPKTRETADHSIPYLVAVALLDGSVTAASFNQRRLQDPAVAALIKKMTIEESSEFTQKYPQEYNCHMEIIDKEGMAHASHTRHPRGNRLNPLTDAQVEEKFRTLAEGLLSDQQLERTAKIVWSLDSQPTLNDLFDSLIV